MSNLHITLLQIKAKYKHTEEIRLKTYVFVKERCHKNHKIIRYHFLLVVMIL